MDERETARGVVVGWDGSAQGETALRWATDEARRRKAPLTVVHSWDVYVGPWSTAIVFPVTDVETAARGLLAEGVRHAREDVADVRGVLGRGTPAETLLKAAEHADLVVVGSRSHSAVGDLVTGSAAAEVAAHAPCPVVVVRGPLEVGGSGTPGPVVAGVDGSPASLEAVGVAFAEAALRGVPLELVLAWPRSVRPDPAPLVDADGLRDVAEERLFRLAAPWREKYPDVAVRADVVDGSPRDVLLSAAEHAALVVVGTRGRGGFRGLLFGSVSRALLDHAPCPVAVAHAADS
ncbi:Universal stress protein [Actinomadura rubteroloni]|uniref:Universal stress protein n=1 Tax=Actinomadura rubteroloni TaxID=1926885 RepID=A0A2P4UER8_9ACTN|nr:universal stress protein [Actinomadura rubteroloni]POM23564.1 Universal stress protein [Actinomadura rubteroloni]